MKCKECGEELTEDTNYCTTCGAKVEEDYVNGESRESNVEKKNNGDNVKADNKSKKKRCMDCGELVEVKKPWSWKGFILLTLFTIGYGIWIYPLYYFVFKQEQCSKCSSKNLEKIEEGSINIKIKEIKLAPLFEDLSSNDVDSFDELENLCSELEIPLKRLPEDYRVNGQQALGVIKGGFLENSIIIFNEFFLCYTADPFMAKYIEIEHVEDNKFTGKCITGFSIAEKIKIKEVIKKSSSEMEMLVNNNKKYTVNYLGGIPNCEKGNMHIIAIEEGIFGYKKRANDYLEEFTLNWEEIKNIAHTTIRKGDLSTKNSATTAGLLTGNTLLLAAGLFSKGEETKDFLKITLTDSSGYNNEVLFESKKAQEIKLYLDEKRTLYYDPEDIEETDKLEDTSNNKDYIEEIRKLAELKKEDLITEEEFKNKKQDLLQS